MRRTTPTIDSERKTLSPFANRVVSVGPSKIRSLEVISKEAGISMATREDGTQIVLVDKR